MEPIIYALLVLMRENKSFMVLETDILESHPRIPTLEDQLMTCALFLENQEIFP